MMAATALCYGIPDISLPRIDGGEVNPGSFVGHELIVFFCPGDPKAAAEDVKAYRTRALDFADCGAWVIGVVSDGVDDIRADAPASVHIALARDTAGAVGLRSRASSTRASAPMRRRAEPFSSRAADVSPEPGPAAAMPMRL